MEKTMAITKLPICKSYITFFLPFNYLHRRKLQIADTLKENDFSYFEIQEASKQTCYGPSVRVFGKELEQYFLPFIERKLFPQSLQENGFHRFTKEQNSQFCLTIRNTEQLFSIISTDIVLGPFGIGFIILRVQLDTLPADITDVLDFMHHFRSVEPKTKEEQGASISIMNGESFQSVHHFLFDFLLPFLKKYMINDPKLGGYFGSLPYFDDERMYISAFLFTEENREIAADQLFRLGNVNGRTPEGDPFISASSEDYITRSLQKTVHDRWAPDTYTIVTDHMVADITNRPAATMTTQLSQYMGTHYYNLLLHYFYKIILMRVIFDYSSLHWKKDDEYVKSLIKFITLFSSWFYSEEISTRSEGKELTKMFRQAFTIDSLYKEVTHTLNELYRNQENSNADRMNLLLFVLTVFTVISGIYGMNLVIEDWQDPFKWNSVTSYTFFEWISLITALSGIGLSIYLIIYMFVNKILRKLRARKNNLYM